MAKIFNRPIEIGGETKVVGTPSITILEYDTSSKVLRAKGSTVPTDADAGYAHGCIFVNTGGGAGTTLYMNEGSSASCDFNAVDSSAGGASTALDNLASVAINTSLISDTDNTDDLGSTAKAWKDAYLKGVLYTDAITEINAGTGVTIDSVLLKDAGISFAGDIAVNTDKFTVAGASGDTVVAGTLDATGNTTLAGTLAVTGTSALTGNVTCSGDLAVSGSFTFGGSLTVNDTLTVDELILDTDGTAPAGTNCYAVRDNSGDLTLNAITGKNIELAIAGIDEYSFDAAKLDFNGNAIDNAGYVILNTATAPANTEVYLVNDNTGDLTLNAVTGKEVHIAIAGTDVLDIAGASVEAKQVITASGGANFADQKLDFTTGYIEFGATPASAGDIRQENNVYIASARNAADNADVNIVKANASDLIEFGANLAATTMEATLTIGAQQISASTGNLTFSGAGYIAMGANPASTGYIRLANNVDIAARNVANSADVNMIKVDASDDVAIGADLQMGANVIYGSTAAHTANTADGSLYLHSTSNATKGMVCIPDTTVGLMIGSDGSVDHATTPGTNIVSIFNGTAPVGTLTNGASLYTAGGELTAIDATGNTTVLSPHTKDGDYIIHSYSAKKKKTIRIHIEKMLRQLAKDKAEYKKFFEEVEGKKEAGQI